jgi:hypothetical protein
MRERSVATKKLNCTRSGRKMSKAAAAAQIPALQFHSEILAQLNVKIIFFVFCGQSFTPSLTTFNCSHSVLTRLPLIARRQLPIAN